MRRYWGFAAAVVAASLGSWVVANYQSFLPDRWQTFISSDGSFSIEFPAKPTPMQPSKTSGERESPTYAVITSAPDGTFFGISYHEASVSEASSIDSLLYRAEADLVQRLHANVVSEAQVTERAYSGRSLVCRTSNSRFCYAHFIVVENGLYVLLVLSDSELRPGNRRLNRFMNSFKILKN